MTVAWLWGIAACLLAAGYGLGRLHAYRVAVVQERERVVSALAGGSFPVWELQARELEDQAHKSALRGFSATARDLLESADRTRARGRDRDKTWGNR